MSQENVDVVKTIQPTGVDLVEYFRELPTAIAAGQGAAHLFADDVEVVFIPGSDPGPRLSFSGVEGIRTGWQDWLVAWETYQVENERYIDAGDEVVVLSQVHARTSHQAVPMKHRGGAVWTFRDGKIARVRFYSDGKMALEAAGLRE
jgi:ketosteroid isomerase-like protein